MKRVNLLVALISFIWTPSNVQAQRGPQDVPDKNPVTEAYCKDPATQKAILTDAVRQKILGSPSTLKEARYHSFTRRRGYYLKNFYITECYYLMVDSTNDRTPFGVRRAGSHNGVPRFKFEFKD